MSVGSTKDHFFTSREVHIQYLLEQAQSPGNPTFKKLSEDSKAFSEQVDRTILDYMIFEEAQNFSAVRVSDEDVSKALKALNRKLFVSGEWKALKTTEKEWQKIFKRKVQAQSFVEFRTKSSVIPVSDQEARRYFDENRLKFESLPFEQFKENIKSYLRRSQVEGRLKDWYDVLKGKYAARNSLSEI